MSYRILFMDHKKKLCLSFARIHQEQTDNSYDFYQSMSASMTEMEVEILYLVAFF